MSCTKTQTTLINLLVFVFSLSLSLSIHAGQPRGPSSPWSHGPTIPTSPVPPSTTEWNPSRIRHAAHPPTGRLHRTKHSGRARPDAVHADTHTERTAGKRQQHSRPHRQHSNGESTVYTNFFFHLHEHVQCSVLLYFHSINRWHQQGLKKVRGAWPMVWWLI